MPPADSQDDFTDLIQVTLRAQLAADGGSTTTYFRVVIENLLVSTGTLTGMARLKVLSQQAWGGKAGDGTYPLPVGLQTRPSLTRLTVLPTRAHTPGRQMPCR